MKMLTRGLGQGGPLVTRGYGSGGINPANPESDVSGSVSVLVGFEDHLVVGPNRVYPSYVPVNRNVINEYANGFGEFQGSRLFQAMVTAAGAPVSIDLTAVACVGGEVGLASVRSIIVLNPDLAPVTFGDDSVGTNILLGALLGTHPRYVVQPSGTYLDQHPLGDGYLVDSSRKNLRFDPGAATVTFKVVVAGS